MPYHWSMWIVQSKQKYRDDRTNSKRVPLRNSNEYITKCIRESIFGFRSSIVAKLYIHYILFTNLKLNMNLDASSRYFFFDCTSDAPLLQPSWLEYGSMIFKDGGGNCLWNSGISTMQNGCDDARITNWSTPWTFYDGRCNWNKSILYCIPRSDLSGRLKRRNN